MTESARVKLNLLKTGINGLDEVLGGGLPEFSFNVIAGAPGCGKTTLAQQIVFHNATPERPALYFTVLGEPPLKMLRYLQQFRFFNPDKVGESVRFIHLQVDLHKGLDAVLAAIIAEVEDANPSIVVVDSFRALTRSHKGPTGDMDNFLQELGLHLTAWQATTFLIGESYSRAEDNPIFTVADSVIFLTQVIERNSVVRKIQIDKIRGRGQVPGLHTFRITDEGLQIFPRTQQLYSYHEDVPSGGAPLSTGIAGLDEMLCGGIPQGYSALIAGPSGSGKTVLCTQFIAEGVQRGEPGIIAVFEKRPIDYLKTVPHGHQLSAMMDAGKLEMFYIRPLDLSIDETLHDLRTAVLRLGARRVVIDSLLGFELALAPINREDFRESLYRMTGALTSLGVTVMMTIELVDSYTDLRFSPHGISFLTDVIIMQRYVEIAGRLDRVMCVVKHRTSPHSQDLRVYDISAEGIHVGRKLDEYSGLLSGMPRLNASSAVETPDSRTS